MTCGARDIARYLIASLTSVEGIVAVSVRPRAGALRVHVAHRMSTADLMVLLAAVATTCLEVDPDISVDYLIEVP